MPILEQEPDVFPDDLFDGARCSGESEPWWALYTRPRCEKELLRRLRAWEIPSYCPLIPRSFRSPAGRRRTSYMPLFRGYVFFRGDDGQWRGVKGSGAGVKGSGAGVTGSGAGYDG